MAFERQSRHYRPGFFGLHYGERWCRNQVTKKVNIAEDRKQIKHRLVRRIERGRKRGKDTRVARKRESKEDKAERGGPPHSLLPEVLSFPVMQVVLAQ